jgi:flagellar biogenesis protein FliO
MQRKQRTFVLLIALLAGIGFILLLFYVRQRLFTRTDPIVLTD